MSKYIDAVRLKAEITDLCANANFYQQKAMEESNREDFVSCGGEISAYAKVFSLIDSLQQEQPAQPKINRCRDCEHRKIGKCSMRNQWWESSYCELKPKTIGGASGFFYSVQDSKVACENFIDKDIEL